MREPTVQHPGEPVRVVNSQSVTITVEGDVTVAGPNPYSGISLGTDGSISFDNGHVSLSSSDAMAGVIDGPCVVQITASEFSCTIMSRTVDIGADTVQGDIVATEQVHPPRVGIDTVGEEVLALGAGLATAIVAAANGFANFCDSGLGGVCAG
jgi:hypothetical protein